MSFRTLCRACVHPIGMHVFEGKWKVHNRSEFVGLVCREPGCGCRIPIAVSVVESPAAAPSVPPLVIHEAKIPEVGP